MRNGYGELLTPPPYVIPTPWGWEYPLTGCVNIGVHFSICDM